MCFSATASFTASAVLAGLGSLSLRAVRRPREAMFAALPLLFAVQQGIEGLVWLSFAHAAPQLNRAMTLAYVFFSHLLWPVWVPLAVRLMEPSPGRRRVLDALLAAGAALSVWLLWLLFTQGVVSRLEGAHIAYVSSSAFAVGSTVLYVLATSASPLCSTHAVVRLFGALALLAFGIAYAFYETWLVSVWCFFAALLSSVVLLHGRRTASRERPSRSFASAARARGSGPG